MSRCMLENDAGADCNCHFELASVNAALDSASCSRTATTLKREIGMPRVVSICGEMNKMIDSIFFEISLRTPTYLRASGLNYRGAQRVQASA